MSKFRYYAAKPKPQTPVQTKAIHTNFLRTGRIVRHAEDWVEEEKRYLTYEEVAARTGIRLEKAGDKTHQRLNSFHYQIQFPRIIFHKTLAEAPHLGYVHVTASKTDFAEYKGVSWGFYMANFSAQIAGGEQFFNHINPGYSRMYFAVAMKTGEDGETRRQVIDHEFRENGVLFKTADPRAALKNVLLLGAKTAQLRNLVEVIA